MKKLSTDEWVAKAKAVHGPKFDYSQAVYLSADKDVTIICPEHGPFQQKATRHLAYGCPKCGVARRAAAQTLDSADVLNRLQSIHGEGLTFPLFEKEYEGTRSMLTVSCQEHGEFTSRASNLLRGQGCPACGRIKQAASHRGTTEEFIARARSVHGDRYDYSESVYMGSVSKLTVICREHGPFKTLPVNHTSNESGCPKCAVEARSEASRDSLESFVRKAREVHGDAYDYSHASYLGSRSEVIVTCKVHGEFSVVASYHINHGVGCPDCTQARGGRGVKLTTAGFIQRARAVHGDRYSYEETEYVRSQERVRISCPDHGVFLQLPHNHLGGSGCSKCADEANGLKQRKSAEEFIAEARRTHGDNLDYSLVNYVTNKDFVTIVCPIHGPFEQTPAGHLKGEGCPTCARERADAKRRVPYAEFLSRAREVHGLTYEYSEEGYESASSRVEVTCPTHGKFQQLVQGHLSGGGCPSCASHYNSMRWSTGSIGQLAIADYIESLGVRVEHNYRFSGRKEVDIFLPDHNLAIEYHGVWFHSAKFKSPSFHKEKLDACSASGIRLVQIFSDEWQNKEAVVKQVLANMLGVTKRKGGARSYSVEYISHQEAREVYNTHHMLGAPVAGGDNIALRDRDGRVASLMTITRPMGTRGSVREGSSKELVRFVNPGSVSGAASRLFSRYVKDRPGVDDVVSFSDNRWYAGTMYATLGFDREEDLRPDYTYTSSGSSERVHKSRMQRVHLAKRLGDGFDPELTERENCERAGIYQVYDAGKVRWRWRRSC